MSCKFQEVNMYGEHICHHPNKGGECTGEYGCEHRSYDFPTYNSSTNCWEKIVDGKVVSVESSVMIDEPEHCKVCDFNAPGGYESLYFGTQNGKCLECCLIKPSPISLRKNPDTPALLQIFVEEDGGGERRFEIPVTYCPICGRKL